MQQKLTQLFSLRLWMLLATLVGGVLYANADTTTYTFTGTDWTAISGGSAANWTSGKNGAGFSNNGIQVSTSVSGANGTSPVSFTNVTKIVATYNTNKSAGAGTLVAQIGSNAESSKSWKYSGSSDGRTAKFTVTWNYDTPQTGKVKITCSTTTNSIYLVSIAITTSTPVSSVSLNKSSTTLEVGDTETLTATLFPDNATNKNVSWSSDDTDVATVSNGVVTAVGVGTAIITVTTEDGSKTATCAVTVNAASRLAVNLTGFTAYAYTIVKGNTTTTSATNDQGGWSAAYTYSSSDEDVATVNASGVITAVAKGAAAITCSLNVSGSDATYKPGETTSMTIEITVNNPSHTVTFSANGSTYGEPASVEEGEDITFPAENPSDVNGYTFLGWTSATISGQVEEAPAFVTSAKMGLSDITYYAVFAEKTKGTETTETDVLTRVTTGITTSGYSNWEDKTGTSGAVYAGNSAGDYESIQLRSNNSNSGIITTTSGGKATKVAVVWNSHTTSGRQIEIYGKKGVAYSSAESLYKGSSESGSSLGTIDYGTSTELAISGDYPYIGIRSKSGALYLTSVSITWTSGTPDTYAHYCTTVSALPSPVIIMADVTMEWGETGKAVAPSATINGDAYDGSYTFTVDDDNLTVASDGTLSCNVVGEYSVTASIAATGEHQAASKTCTVTVTKKDVTLSFANEIVRKVTSDAAYTQAATVTPDSYNGTVSYSKESASTSEGAEVNSTTAEVTFSATGSVIVKATAPATELYNEATATYTIRIQTTPTIPALANVERTYGSTYTLDISDFACGDISMEASNTAIATVDGLTITPAAVGTIIITVNTAESDTYTAGSTSFTFKVNPPTPQNTASKVYGRVSSTSALTDGKYLIVYDDAYVAFNGGLETLDAASNTIGITYDYNDVLGYYIKPTEATRAATFDITAVEGGYTIKSASGKYIGQDSDANGLAASESEAYVNTISCDTYEADIISSGNAHLRYNSTSGQERFRYFKSSTYTSQQAIQLYKLVDGYESVTLNSSGYLTYASIYPMDFTNSLADGYSAWQITGIDGTTITFERITGAIAGGQGVLLKGTAGASINIPLKSSETELTGNKLAATLAPTYFEDETMYALSGDKFYLNEPCTLKANRAYIPANEVPSDVKGFIFVFNDIATGIVETQTVSSDEAEPIFNLAGQRLQKPQRGINIVGGRKVLVK